jgi:crossover junction endodeoxyribonuclease RuvC
MIAIGIDPGLTGAVAVLSDDAQYATVYDMPVFDYSKTGFVKRALDPDALAALLAPFQTQQLVEDVTVYMERVSAFSGQGAASVFSLGMSYWGAAGVVGALALPLVLVEPKAWKNHFGLARDKELARALASKLYPRVDLRYKKNHGRAEALLIARYGKEIAK